MARAARLLLAAGLALGGGAGVAQEYDPMSREQCERLLRRIDMLRLGTPVAGEVLEPEGETCRFRDIRLNGLSGLYDYGIDVARARVGGAGRLDYGLPPLALDIEIEGGHLIFRVEGDPVTSWLLSEQTRMEGGTAFRLRGHWDRDTRAVRLEEFAADFPGENAVALSGAIEGVDLTDALTTERSLESGGLARLEASVVSHGLFEQMVLMPLGQALLTREDDPDDQVAALKARAAAWIAGAPESLLDAASRAALAAMVEDMPHPRGRLDLRLEADPALRVENLVPLFAGQPAALLAILARVRLVADYTPVAD